MIKKIFRSSWVVIGILLFFIVTLMISRQYSKDVQMWIISTILILTVVGMVIFFIFFIIDVITNDRFIKKFRKELKVGDETAGGKVIEINNQVVKIEFYQDISNIYPPDHDLI